MDARLDTCACHAWPATAPSLVSAPIKVKFWLLQEHNSQALSNSLWAFAQLRHHPGKALLDAAGKQLLATLQDFNPQVTSQAVSIVAGTVSLCLAAMPLPGWMKSDTKLLILSSIGSMEMQLILLLTICKTLGQCPCHGPFMADMHAAAFGT